MCNRSNERDSRCLRVVNYVMTMSKSPMIFYGCLFAEFMYGALLVVFFALKVIPFLFRLEFCFI